MSLTTVNQAIRTATADKQLSAAEFYGIIAAAKRNIKPNELAAIACLQKDVFDGKIKTVESFVQADLNNTVKAGPTTPTFGHTLVETVDAPRKVSAGFFALIGSLFGLKGLLVGYIFGNVLGYILDVALSPLTALIGVIRHPVIALRD
jgi:hypothetical protein